MDLIFTSPISPLESSLKRGTGSKPTDSKVKGLILEKIGEVTLGSRGALLPSAIAPRVMVDLLSAFAVPALLEAQGQKQIELLPFSRRSRRARFKKAFAKSIPVGLRRCTPHSWINAWIQFLLFLPGISDLFSFIPRSFDSFREFLDQYAIDQEENRSVSIADSATLVRCLIQFLPVRLFRFPNRVDLYEILRFFLKALFPFCFFDFVGFRPEWHQIWKTQDEPSFEEAVLRKVEGRPPEFLLAVKESHSHPPAKRQFFTRPDRLCYELNAFIEQRPDKVETSYIAYLKVEGSWYQCDDDRISTLRSPLLPLHRSVFLYYKRLALN